MAISSADKKGTSSMFAGLTTPRDLTKYTLTRGTTDWANMAQWNNFEGGYSYFTVVKIPTFLEKLADMNSDYNTLINDYRHILEYEFKGLDGIENITSETGEVSNNINTMQFINKVNMQSSSQFQLRYTEKSGAVLTKTHELFLTGIKDGRTQVKHYHGLLEDGIMDETGYEYETFSFMYLVTDNSMRKLEKAYYIVGAQPTTAEYQIYNGQRGEIEFKELSVEFNGFPLTGKDINMKGKEMLDWLNDPSNPNKLINNSNNYEFHGVKGLNTKI